MTFHPWLMHGLTVAIGWNPAGTYTGDPSVRKRVVLTGTRGLAR